MTTPLQSLIAAGTKLWLDSVDPDEIARNRALGATGATSNPIIIAGLIETGRFDTRITQLLQEGVDDETLAWRLTDQLVRHAQEVFAPVWETAHGNDGYVSFELDPLLEDLKLGPPQEERTRRYIALGKQWSSGHRNRMIKVPATPGGLAALEELAASGVTLNVTLIFSDRQYEIARENIWRGAQRRRSLEQFKSVYSIFVSRLDVYTEKHVPDLSPQAQGQVGIVNAKRIWRLNQQFWADKRLPLNQEMIFASTGTKKPGDPPWKYVESFAGSDIETNPPATNAAVQASGRTFTRQIDKLPPRAVLDEIDAKVDIKKLEETLMDEGLKKFADPQKALLALIKQKRQALQPVGANERVKPRRERKPSFSPREIVYMPGTFRDASAGRFDSSGFPRPEDLPHGLVAPPAEVVDQVAQERAQFPPDIYTDAYAKRVLDDWTLSYYYEGLDIAYRSVPEGVEILAVGAEEIGRLVQGKSPEELLTFTIKEP